MKNARPQNSETSAADTANYNTPGELFSELSIEKTCPKLKAKASSKFTGTGNPRHLRAIQSLMQRPRFRNDLQAITGASNTPELVAELRRRGLETPCVRVPILDFDGLVSRPGIYSFNASDRRKVFLWIRARDARGKA